MYLTDLDKTILKKIDQIMSSRAANDAKYTWLDNLQLLVMEQHPDGLLAAVLQNISDAQTQCLYPNGGDAKR